MRHTLSLRADSRSTLGYTASTTSCSACISAASASNSLEGSSAGAGGSAATDAAGSGAAGGSGSGVDSRFGTEVVAKPRGTLAFSCGFFFFTMTALATTHGQPIARFDRGCIRPPWGRKRRSRAPRL